jgi:hypothetical protein
MDDMSNKLRWTKVYEEGTISVWRKPSCHLHCDQEANVKLLGLPPLCIGEDPDSAWYANISMCIRSKTLTQVTAKPNDSYFWRGLMHIKDEVLANGSFDIKDGTNMRF